MISRGSYGINFVDKAPIPNEDSVDIETLCKGFLKLQNLGVTLWIMDQWTAVK